MCVVLQYFICVWFERKYASMEVNKERDPKPSERMCHKKNYFLLKKCMHCLYTKVVQNYFLF